jgi:hypothetical protein
MQGGGDLDSRANLSRFFARLGGEDQQRTTEEGENMIMKRAGLTAVAALAVTVAGAASAGAETGLRFNILPFGTGYQDYYGEPYFVPAPRYYYYYQARPRVRPRARYYSYQSEPEYYEPEYYEPEYYEPEAEPRYAPPRKKQRTTKLPAQKPAAKQDQQKSAAVSCDKATKIVSDYGFSKVKATSCTGKVYAFNAQRDGKPFTVKLSSASGELMEVKKH